MTTIDKNNIEEIPYIRVGCKYYKKIKVWDDDLEMNRNELSKWEVSILGRDYKNDPSYIDRIPRYDKFCIKPNNIKFQQAYDNLYNHYAKFNHVPKEGEWPKTEMFLKHIFGEQYNLGLRYVQALYKYPEKRTVVLALVSTVRLTGKTTFLNWLNVIFGDNMITTSQDSFESRHNLLEATKNIIAIDETMCKDASVTEKIKVYSTQRTITVNPKGVDQYSLPFYGKLILASNNEINFAKISDEEIRFFVRKIELPVETDNELYEKMIKEIPAFLAYLLTLPEIDWKTTRSGFTKEELRNKWLDAVVEESYTPLYKDLKEAIQDYFENHPYISVIQAIPEELKERFFLKHNKYDTNYIRTALKTEFRLKPEDNSVWYKPITSGYEKKKNRVYTFIRKDFVKVDELLPLEMSK